MPLSLNRGCLRIRPGGALTEVTFVCLHGMFIAMTWESNLTERWREGVGCLLGQFEAGQGPSEIAIGFRL